jgi:hypothetical protein
MRILKFLEPVTRDSETYDARIPFPKEGELFHRPRGRPYTFRIDGNTLTSQTVKRLVEDYLSSPNPEPSQS